MKIRGLLAVILMTAALAQSQPASKQTEKIERAIAVVQELADLSAPEQKIPDWLFRKVQGIAVFPGVVKAAYGLGGQFGRGILLLRSDKGDWSLPAFASLVGGSIGWQIGVQKTDIILFFKTRRGIEDIVSRTVTLGTDLSVAAGPVGRQAEASTNLDMEAEIYSYSKSRGLFAGISLKGGSIKIDRDANRSFYGLQNITAAEIFAGKGISTPAVVERLWKALQKAAQLRGGT